MRSSMAWCRTARIVCMLTALGAAACEREPETVIAPPRVKQVFHLNGYEKDFGYSQAVLIDKTLYVSGSVAVDANGRLVAPGDMAGQMRAAYANIRRTLAAHAADFDEVVKETIYTTGLGRALRVLRQGAPADRVLGAGAAPGGPGVSRRNRGCSRATVTWLVS
jgi:enamine deaminase RidA (YjgF/YER057c/UK114 family)